MNKIQTRHEVFIVCIRIGMPIDKYSYLNTLWKIDKYSYSHTYNCNLNFNTFINTSLISLRLLHENKYMYLILKIN